MKKLTALLIVILPFALTACTIKKPVANDKQEQSVAQQDDSLNVKGSIFDIVNLGKDVKCTYEDAASNMSGVMYVSGKKVRTDITYIADDESIEASTLIDNDWAYMWSPELAQGTRINIADLKYKTDELTNNKVDITTEVQDKLSEKFNYHCEKWDVDQATFDLPEDVTFTDTTEILNNLQQNDGKNMCVACDYIQDEAKKAECKSSLNCD
jgi:hypothetical protein